jgi:hypothetical protein
VLDALAALDGEQLADPDLRDDQDHDHELIRAARCDTVSFSRVAMTVAAGNGLSPHVTTQAYSRHPVDPRLTAGGRQA